MREDATFTLGEGLVGYAALHKGRAGRRRDDRSALRAVRRRRALGAGDPADHKDRCIGVFDLASPELDAFSKRHVEMLTPLANHDGGGDRERAALRDRGRQRGAARKGSALRAARADGAAAAGAAEAAARRRRGGALRRRRASSAATSTTSSRPSPTASSSPSATCRARACRRRSTARSPASWCAAARSAAATRRCGRRRPASCVDEHHPAPAAARRVLLHAVLRVVRLQAASRDDRQLGPAVSDPLHADGCAQIDIPGVPLGSFAGSTYDEVTLPARSGRPLRDLLGRHLRGDERERRGVHGGAARSTSSSGLAHVSARAIVDAIFEAVEEFRGQAAPNDDMTAVALKITA